MRVDSKIVVAVLVLVGIVALTLSREVGAHGVTSVPLAPSENALVSDPGSCTLAAADARAFASESERKARARWERVWYEAAEAPRAVHELMRAIACYRTLGDREARARAETDLTRWQRELKRRYVRARLDLTLALRAQDPARIIEESMRLRDLLSKAGAGADAYQESLRRIERNASAARAEQQTAQQER